MRRTSRRLQHQCASVVRNAFGYDFHFLGVSHGKWVGDFSGGESAMKFVNELAPSMVCVEMSRKDLTEIGTVLQSEKLGRWIPSKLLAKWEGYPEHVATVRYCLDNNIAVLPVDRDDQVTTRIVNEKLAFAPGQLWRSRRFRKSSEVTSWADVLKHMDELRLGVPTLYNVLQRDRDEYMVFRLLYALDLHLRPLAKAVAASPTPASSATSSESCSPSTSDTATNLPIVVLCGPAHVCTMANLFSRMLSSRYLEKQKDSLPNLSTAAASDTFRNAPAPSLEGPELPIALQPLPPPGSAMRRMRALGKDGASWQPLLMLQKKSKFQISPKIKIISKFRKSIC